MSSAALRANALAAIRRAPHSVHLDFIALAIQGKQMRFEKVIKTTLKTEQADDDNKKEYCAKQFDETRGGKAMSVWQLRRAATETLDVGVPAHDWKSRR